MLLTANVSNSDIASKIPKERVFLNINKIIEVAINIYPSSPKTVKKNHNTIQNVKTFIRN